MIKKVLKLATLDGKVKISINIPTKLMEEITLEAKEENMSRTAWLTLAIMERLAKRKKNNEID